jgi:hypothetical protein
MTPWITYCRFTFSLESDDERLFFAWSDFPKECAIDRTSRPAGSDEILARVRIVDDELAVVSSDAGNGVLADRTARTLQKPVVEFDPPDRILTGWEGQGHIPKMEVKSSIQSETMRVGGWIQLKMP